MENQLKEAISVDNILAKFEIKTKGGEVWIKNPGLDPVKIVGLSHDEANSIIVVFIKR